MEKRQVLINAIMSVVQTIAVGLIVFVLYRYLLKTIGVEQFGIWSLVVATTGVAQIANFGLSGSVVKFVAKYVARDEYETASQVVQTAALSVGFFLGFVLLVGYPWAKWVLGWVLPVKSFPSALEILPVAFIAFWLLIVTSVFQAGLDGIQRVDLRNFLLIAGSIINLILCYIFAPSYGLVGVAYARVIENFTVLLGTWFLLRRNLSSLPLFPYKLQRKLFKEIFFYGINFQLMSGITLLYDPITKAFLSKFGGLSLVGYYEMASKMIWQLRGLVVSATYVILPTIASMHEKMPEKIQSLYLASYQLLFYLALPLFSLIIVCIPLISEIWIGHYERIFVVFSTLLAVGWFVNTLNAPAFYANLGIGEIRWNVIGHILIAFLNVVLGVALGAFYGGVGVVVAWVSSLAVGSSFIYLSYHITHRIPMIDLLPRGSRSIIVTCLVGILIAVGVNSKIDHSSSTILLSSTTILLFLIIVFLPFWHHPMRGRLMGWVNNELLNR